MSLSVVRTFIKDRIRLSYPDLKEHNDLNVLNIPSTKLNDYYQITYGEISTFHNDNTLQDSFPVTVDIFKKGFRDPISAMDEILDEACTIRASIVDSTATLLGNIEDVEAVSILPLPINENNDNTIKVSLEFNIRLYFATV